MTLELKDAELVDALRAAELDLERAAIVSNESIALDAASSLHKLQKALDASRPPTYRSPLRESASLALVYEDTVRIVKRAHELAHDELGRAHRRPERGIEQALYGHVRGDLFREVCQSDLVLDRRAAERGGVEPAPGQLHPLLAWTIVRELRELPAPGKPWTRAQRLAEVAFTYRYQLLATELGIPHEDEDIDALGEEAFDQDDAAQVAATLATAEAARLADEAHKAEALAARNRARANATGAPVLVPALPGSLI